MRAQCPAWLKSSARTSVGSHVLVRQDAQVSTCRGFRSPARRFPTALEVGAAPPLAAAHRSGSPPSAPATAAPARPLPTTHAHHPRPAVPRDRSIASRPLEGDLIIGNDHLSAIGTLVERQTRMVRLVHLLRSDADSLHTALVARMQDLPPTLMRSITWDQGTEMARHLSPPPTNSARRSTSATPDHPGNAAPTKHQRTAARLLPQGRQPHRPLHEPPARRRTRAQPPPPHGPPRPLSRGPIRRPANLTKSVSVATLTRTHHVDTGLTLRRRRHYFKAADFTAEVPGDGWE